MEYVSAVKSVATFLRSYYYPDSKHHDLLNEISQTAFGFQSFKSLKNFLEREDVAIYELWSYSRRPSFSTGDKDFTSIARRVVEVIFGEGDWEDFDESARNHSAVKNLLKYAVELRVLFGYAYDLRSWLVMSRSEKRKLPNLPVYTPSRIQLFIRALLRPCYLFHSRLNLEGEGLELTSLDPLRSTSPGDRVFCTLPLDAEADSAYLCDLTLRTCEEIWSIRPDLPIYIDQTTLFSLRPSEERNREFLLSMITDPRFTPVNSSLPADGVKLLSHFEALDPLITNDAETWRGREVRELRKMLEA